MHFSKFCLLLVLFAGLSARPAGAQAPHIAGDVYISVKEGTFRADLDVSNLPATASYVIRLNSGLNVAWFRDSTDRVTYDTRREYDGANAYEAFGYWFPGDDGKSRFLPKRFKVSYAGAFPVYGDSLKRSEWGDWKGNIAFNGKTVRAAEQTAWYPQLYDAQEDRVYQDVTFDITIHCPDAKAIYMNGCPPQYGQNVRFTSGKPFPMMIFAGDFTFTKEQETYFVNTGLGKGQAQVLDQWISRIKQYYEEKLRVPYGPAVALLAGAPVSLRNEWMFVTYPTIAAINPQGRLRNVVSPDQLTLTDSAYVTFLSHEVGHYYFGTVVSPNSPLRWVFLEGITEYLALQATRDLLGKSFYDRKIREYVSASKRMKDFVPLKNVKASGETGETYRYKYLPLLLTALETQIGREQVWKWLNTILNAKKPVTDYQLFVSSLRTSGVEEKTVAGFERDYLLSEEGLPKLLSAFNANSYKIYCFGISREIPKELTKKKLQVIYTAIRTIPDEDAELSKLSKQFFNFVKGQCKPSNEMCTGDFNSYDTLEEAKDAQERWIKNFSKLGNYTFKQVDL